MIWLYHFQHIAQVNVPYIVKMTTVRVRGRGGIKRKQNTRWLYAALLSFERETRKFVLEKTDKGTEDRSL